MQEVFQLGKNLFEKYTGETTRKQGARKAGEASDLDEAFKAFSRCCNEQTVNGKLLRITF